MAVPESPGGLVAEEVVADRYCVKRRLGTGGMGEAWLAEDQILHRKLVLKRLTGAQSADGKESTSRAGQLLSEAKRATAIDSPHIAQVYDVCSHGGEWLIAMEYISGRSLREALAEPLSPERFFALTLQLADAIQAAHAAGILHCDIKPENIMVTEQGFVKVLDFGLARMMAAPDATGATMSVPGKAFAGTPGYIAPEVLRESAPTEQSDIFSLGVVLYEMAGGQAPFHGKSLADSVQMTLALEPAPLELKKRGLAEDLNRVLKKALMKQPEQRYATVRDLAVDLRSLANGGGVSGTRASDWKRVGIAALGAAALLGVLAATGFLGLRYFQHRGEQRARAVTAVAKTRLLAVLPFRMIGSGNTGAAAYSEGLREVITSSLARVAPSDRIDVLAASEVRTHGLKTPEDAHKELGADLVIDGSYQQYRNQVRILYALIDASGKVLRSDMVTSAITDPFRLQDQVVKGVLDMLQLANVAPGEDSAKQFGTEVPAAYEAYLRGVGYLRDFQIADNLKRAADSFTAATKADPQFAAAYAGLGETQWAEYQATTNETKIAPARDSCRKALALNADVAEAQICQGLINDGTGKAEEAQKEFQRALELDPQSDRALNGLARTWEKLEKPEEAEKVYRQAIEARPFYWANYYALANFLMRRAEYSQAASELEQAVGKFPANCFLARRLGVAYFLEGQFDQAAAVLQKAIHELPHAEAYMDLGQVYLHKKQWAQAINALEDAAKMKPHSYSVQADLADAYAWSGTQKDKAEGHYRAALDEAKASLRVDSENLDALMVASYCAAALNDRDNAMRYLDAALRHAPEDAEVNYYAARVFARMGDADSAQDWAQKAIEHGYSRADIESAPDLESISAEVAMARPKG